MHHLPDEILLLITDHIEDEGMPIDQQDKLNLLLVCQRWRSLFTAPFYSDLSIVGSQIPFLVRSLHRNPSLGPSIRKLYLCCWSRLGNGINISDCCTPALQTLVHTVSQSPEEATEWERDLKRNNNDAWLAILLVFLENVTTLYMDHPGDAIHFPRLLARAATREKPFDKNPIFQNLVTAEIVGDCDIPEVVLKHVESVPFCHFPSLRFFRGDSMIDCDYTAGLLHPGQRAVAGTSPIRQLSFRLQCSLSKGIAAFITSCANLEVLEYQHCNIDWVENRIGFHPRVLYNALITQKHSLQVLELNHQGDAYVTGFQELPKYNDWFGSLKEFVNLRQLHIRLHNLLDFGMANRPPTVSFVDVLPRSLEYLCVANCEESHFSVLVHNLYCILAHRKEFPNLKKIDIQPHVVMAIDPSESDQEFPPFYGVLPSTRARFAPTQAAFKQAGLELSFIMNGVHLVRR